MIRLSIDNNKSTAIYYSGVENKLKLSVSNSAGLSSAQITATENYLKGYISITNYSDFLFATSKTVRLQLDGIYYVFEDSEIFYLFFIPVVSKRTRGWPTYYRNSNLNIIFVAKYEPTKNLLDFVRKLFKMDKDGFAVIPSTIDSGFNFIAPWQVLHVLFAKANIESNGEILFEEHHKAKKGGGKRTYYAPHDEIKASLQRLNVFFQKVYDKRNNDIQIAYKKHKNVKTGALQHKDNKYVFNLDLHDFYPSCKRELVKKYTDFLFAYSYNRDFIENYFLDAILINDGLFIGSPVSGTLANVIISSAVKYMDNICKGYNMVLTVYADDISVSSNKPIARAFVEDIFNTAFSKYGLDKYFTLNNKKAVGFSGCNRKITGVSINVNNQVTVSRKYYRDIRAKLANLAAGDTTINVNKLRGKIAYALMIDDSGKIYRYLNKFLSTVQEYKLCSDEKLEELESKFGGK